jgi:pimeloyl-ACP methyl ester carboxylesterase
MILIRCGSSPTATLLWDTKAATTCVGHSTGGGEATRYIAGHGADRVAKAVLQRSADDGPGQRVLCTELQATGTLRQKRATRDWTVVGWSCACGAVFDRFKCRWQTNRLLADCCPTPISHEPLATLRRARSGSYFPFFQSLAATAHGRDHGWHGACSIGHRADAQTFNPTQHPFICGELKC